MDDGVFFVSAGRGGRRQTIRYILTEILDHILDAGHRPHFWLGRKPDRGCHRKDGRGYHPPNLQEELLMVEALPMTERRGEGRSRQLTCGGLDQTNPSA